MDLFEGRSCLQLGVRWNDDVKWHCAKYRVHLTLVTIFTRENLQIRIPWGDNGRAKNGRKWLRNEFGCGS